MFVDGDGWSLVSVAFNESFPVILVVVVSVFVCRIVACGTIDVGLMSMRIGGNTSIVFVLIVIIVAVDDSDFIVLNGQIIVSGFRQKEIIHCQFEVMF